MKLVKVYWASEGEESLIDNSSELERIKKMIHQGLITVADDLHNFACVGVTGLHKCSTFIS